MNLFEQISRIKEVMGINESKSVKDMLIPANPKSILHHYSTYKNRESILQNGLIPKIGRQTLNYMSHNYPDVDPIPMIFAQDTRHGNFFGVYGSDVWEIDLKKANVNWYKDPIHKDDGSNWDFFVTIEPIPPHAIKLISSNEQRDDDMEVYRQTGEYPNRNPVEEPEKPIDLEKEKFDKKWSDLDKEIEKLSDDDLMMSI